MNKDNFLIYGSYGYTGKLIAELACQQGLRPVLGGRNKAKLIEQAKQLNLDYLVFDVDNLDATKAAIKHFLCVVHCAGPFVDTYKNMAEACIQNHTHYLDITGEVEVIEGLSNLNSRAQAANIMILPGAGFDVVPSDCLAQHLKSRVPDATKLTLAIKASGPTKGGSSVSRGTAKTMLNGFSSGSLIRDEGVLKTVPGGSQKREFDFGNQHTTICASISWGDLASAWWSTHIPHIETYMAIPSKFVLINKLINPIKFIFKWKPLKNYIRDKINKMPEGPTAEMRKQSRSYFFGEVMNERGDKAVSLLKTPEGYDLTAMTTILIVKKILTNNFRAGFQTPSTAYGKDLVLEIPNVVRVDV